ncbi:FAD-dependent monooxygenase [Paenibacillus antri]|uniref:FAD-dependent monooxygenase n=1 Tax=Paenibacillus antri TaxID=2582848 RepID=A0A5R9FYU4_9BACL|nr:NAD(P)/FAD-dependent oxidoreductase [Paenibacillus antri]TLS48671.1 FAD-dependent monooxygenase [Paenibacillus antri]
MKTQYDVIVVGARVAGSALAYELSKAGFEVLLLDRSTFPSDILSTHNFFNNSIGMLREMGVLDKLLATGTPTYRRAKLQIGGAAIDGDFPEANGETFCMSIRRTYLDHILFEHAAAQPGVHAMQGFRVTELLKDGDAVRGVVGVRRDGGVERFEARFVVGADGRRSAVRDLAGSRCDIRVPTDYASYVGYFSGFTQSGERHVEMYKTDDTIVIAFPTSDSLYVIGVMFPLARKAWIDRMREAPEESFRAAVDAGLPATDFPARLREAALAEPIKGLLGYDNDWYAGMGDGWALVGDALMFKDPAVGQGLHDALYGARALAATLSSVDKAEWGPRWGEMAARYEGAMKSKLSGLFYLGCKFSQVAPVTPEDEMVNGLIGSDPQATRTFLGLYNYMSGPEDVEREVGRLMAERSIS